MGNQSSRIYGIKVKEHRNYFEYPAENPEIKIYYDANASKQWIIKSNYDSIWYNGQSYPSGYTVISFKDGTDCQNNPFMLMAPHEEDGIIVNYFYRITGRFASYPEIELNEEFDISEEAVISEPSENESDNVRYTIESGRPGNHYSQLYVRKFINNEEVGHTIVTPESINAYKVAHSSNYYNYLKVFNALLFDWRGMAPSIYEEPYSFILYSNVTYLEWNGITRMRHTKITEWTWDTEVNMDIQDFSRQYDPVESSDKDNIKYNIASNSNNSEIINVQKMVNNSVVVTKSVSKNDILSYKNTNHGNPLRVFDNLLFDCLQLPESYPNYTFVIKADNSYLKYDGNWINYGNDITSWPTNAFVNFEIEDYSNRYEQQVLEGDKYNVYIEHIKWNSQYQYWVNVDSPIALTKDEVCYDIFYDHKEMYYNNHYHKAAWLVYDQPSEGYKKIGKLAIMYADPFWVLITTADGIYWNGHTYKGRKLLKMWKDDEAVDLTMIRTESRKKTTFGNEYDRIRYTVITNNGDSKIKLTKYINDIKSTESIFNPLTTEQRTFSGIVLYCINTSVISMYSKSDDLTVDGIPYTTNEKIGEWLISEKVSYSINDKDYQKVNYVITTSELNNTITLIKQINDLEDDTVVFDPETDCPLNFYNIRFAYSNGKVSVYSKCDYIKLSGSTYKNGNLITNWPLEEKVNFAIQDESDKYEVTKTTTYTVKTENVTETDYDIITLMDEHWTPLKICKINNGKTSNEEIVNFYDCQYEPYFNYDDKLQLIYDPATTYWTLKSLSDEIYKDNVNYPEGSVIDTWPYGTDRHIYGVGHQDISHYEIRLHSIEVDSKASYETTHEYITNPTYTIITQPDHSLDVTNNQPGSLPVTRNIRYMDAIDWYTFFGLKIRYNTTTSEWEVKAGNNLIVVGQILYKKGDIVSKWDYYENVDKTINTLVEDIKHTTRNDKEKDLLVSSKNLWLYGYIWQKEETPPPPVLEAFDIITFTDYAWNTRYAKIKLVDGHISMDDGYILYYSAYATPIGLGFFYNNYLNKCYVSNRNYGYEVDIDENGNVTTRSYNNFYKQKINETDGFALQGIISAGTFLSIVITVDPETYTYGYKKYMSNDVNDIETLLEESELQCTIGEYYRLNGYFVSLINNKLCFLMTSDDFSYMSLFIADVSSTIVYTYGFYNVDTFDDDIRNTIRNLYPLDNEYTYNMQNMPTFDKDGYIYRLIECEQYYIYGDSGTVRYYFPGFIKINPLNGNWSFIDLSNSPLHTDMHNENIPEHMDRNIAQSFIIEDGEQYYLYARTYIGLYIYQIVFNDGEITLIRKNYFDGSSDAHTYVDFGELQGYPVRCYPSLDGCYFRNERYEFGINFGGNIRNRPDNRTVARWSNGLLSNSGKGIYAVVGYSGSGSTRLIAMLGSPELTPHPYNQVVLSY